MKTGNSFHKRKINECYCENLIKVNTSERKLLIFILYDIVGSLKRKGPVDGGGSFVDFSLIS